MTMTKYFPCIRNILLTTILLAVAACEVTIQRSGTGCIDCHTDQELLMEIADPVPPDYSSGDT